MEVFIPQLVVCPPWRLPLVPGLAREPPDVQGMDEKNWAQQLPLHPALVEKEEASYPKRRSEEMGGVLAGRGCVPTYMWYVLTNWEFLDGPLMSQIHRAKSPSAVRMA